MRTRVFVARAGAFTLVELVISLALLGVLVTSLFSLAAESSALLGDNEVDHAVLSEGHRAFALLSEIIQRTGRSRDTDTVYPRVVDGGSTLELKLPESGDGDSLPFDPQTGTIRWGKVLSIRRTQDGRVALWKGETRLGSVARGVSSLLFATAETDPSLGLGEIAVKLETRKSRRDASDAVFSFSIRIQMRNNRLPPY